MVVGCGMEMAYYVGAGIVSGAAVVIGAARGVR